MGPPEESLHKKCTTRRGGLGRSTPGVFGGFPMVVFEDRRKAAGNLPQKLPQGVSLLLVYPKIGLSWDYQWC